MSLWCWTRRNLRSCRYPDDLIWFRFTVSTREDTGWPAEKKTGRVNGSAGPQCCQSGRTCSGAWKPKEPGLWVLLKNERPCLDRIGAGLPLAESVWGFPLGTCPAVQKLAGLADWQAANLLLAATMIIHCIKGDGCRGCYHPINRPAGRCAYGQNREIYRFLGQNDGFYRL